MSAPDEDHPVSLRQCTYGEYRGYAWRIDALYHNIRLRKGYDPMLPKVYLPDGSERYGHWCAYIEVAQTQADWCESILEVNGGLTYGYVEYEGKRRAEYPDGAVCHKGCYVLGWDYCHAHDIDTRYTFDDILRDVCSAIDMVADGKDSPEKENGGPDDGDA